MMSEKVNPLRVLVVGCGNMGASHAMSYHTLDGFEICGLVSTGKSKEVLNEKLGGGYALFTDYEEALKHTQPDAVCISTYQVPMNVPHVPMALLIQVHTHNQGFAQHLAQFNKTLPGRVIP